MNRVYRLVWNDVLGHWVVVAENARARGKRSAGLAAMVLALGAVSAAHAAPLPPAPTQLPTGGKVVAGSATITTGAAVLTVDQGTTRAAIDWNTFDLGSAAQVNFRQPDAGSATLNRVLDSNPSRIFGRITANGQVFLSNPNGVYFGSGASVDVGGLTATTNGISNADFMAGRSTFTSNGATGSVINDGELRSAIGGYIALLAPEVRNSGVIVARLGTVAMASGEAVTLNFAGNHLAGITVEPSTIKALVENRGAVLAPGGLIVLSARALDRLQGGVVRNTGTLEATGLSTRGGRIVLEASDRIDLASTSVVDVSGATGGGTIEVGGGWQGTGDVAHAQDVAIASGAKLLANATVDGDGGTIAVWSDGTTRVAGTIAARGAQAGNGGMIETSGHRLDVAGIAVDASSPRGAAGTWLLDPYSLTVSGGPTTATESPTGTWTSNAGGSVIINTDLDTALNAGTAVVLQTSGTLGDGQGNGDITVASPISKTSGAATSLTLKAGGSIVVAAAISSTAGALNTTLNANVLGDGGSVSVNAPITTFGGNLVIGGGIDPSTQPAVGTVAASIGVSINAAIATGGGAITMNGTGYDGSADGNHGVLQNAPIASGGGNVGIVGIGAGAGGSERGYFNAGYNLAAAGGNISINGTGSSTSISGGNDGIKLGGGTTSTTGSGTITFVGTAYGASGASSGVWLSGSTLGAVDGLVSLTGTSDATSSAASNKGVIVGGPLQSTGSGGLQVNGFGGGTGSGGSDVGIDVRGTVDVNGAITLVGVGGDAGGTGPDNHGVNLVNDLSGHGSAISITGTGGASQGNGNHGIHQSANVYNAGAGSITLSGTGGGTGLSEHGIDAPTGDTLAGSGNISFTGDASATGSGSGVLLIDGAISTTGSGTVTVVGTARGTGAESERGVLLGNPGSGISTVDGTVSVTGINNATSATTDQLGVYIAAGAAIQSIGTGGVIVTGKGGGTDAAGSDYGIYMEGAGGIVATLAGGHSPITLVGTGGDAGGTGSSNFGVYLKEALAGNGGAISITGTGGAASGSLNDGVPINYAVTNTGSGGISINGTGGGTGASGVGVRAVANVTTQTGNVSITGAGSAAGTGSGNHGISIGSGSTVSTTGSGTITLDGTGTGTSNFTDGIIVTGGGVVSAVDGLLKATGRNNSTAGNNSIGVLVSTNGSTMVSSGTGGVTVIGSGGGSGTALGNYGVHVNAVNAFQSTGTGGVNITGTGGGNGGAGGTNYGVYVQQSLSLGGGALSIDGTGGNSSGSNNYGISQTAAIGTTGTGSVTLNGTGGGTGSSARGYSGSASISTGTGDISITGMGSPLAAFTGAVGIFLSSTTNTVSTAGSGKITLIGTGRGSSGSANGVTINGAKIIAVDGRISVTGSSGSTSASASNDGVYVTNGLIKSTGAGGVTVVGSGGGTSVGGSDYGVLWDTSNEIQSTGTGAIAITGTGGGGGGAGSSDNVGVYSSGALSSAAPITITGTGGNSSGISNHGIRVIVSGPISNTGSGALTLVGTGGGSGLGEHGVVVTQGTVTGTTGNVSVTGTGSVTGIGSGVYLGGGGAVSRISTGGSGTVTVNGTARGFRGEADYGVYLGNALGVISSVDGLVSVTGTNNTTSSTTGQMGVFIASGATIRSTGTGAVAVTGTGGGRDATGGDYGINMAGANGIQATLAGGNSAITLIGTGGDTGGTGGNNTGVLLGAALTGNGGPISITGTPGNASVGVSNGISLASVAAGTATLTMTSSGAVVTSGALTAANLRLLGAGANFVLTNAANAVGTLAADTASLNYKQTGNLVIGTVGGTSGITATGTVLVNAIGNLTLTNGVSASGTGTALTLVDSGAFTNNVGASALTVTGGGRWLVWSASPSSDDRGGLVYGFKQYNATYGVTTVADASLNGVLYSLAPTIATTLVGTASKVYDGTTAATLSSANYSFGPGIDGDTVAPVIATSGVYDDAHVGTGKLVTVSGLTPGASNGAATVYGYQIASGASGNIGAVTRAPLTVTANDGTKTYGATLGFAGTKFTPTGLVNSETIGSVSLSSSGAASGAHVAGGPYAIVASAATGGTFTASDYTIGYSSGVLTVNPATLTVTANNASKTYGGTPTFNGTDFTSTGLVNSETIGSVTLSSAGAASGAHVVGGPYAIVASAATGGTFTASDYAVGYANGALTVNPAALTVTADGGTKTYGATLAFAGTEFTSTGLVNSETIGSVTLSSSGASSGAHVVGSPYAIVASAATGGTFTASDYTIGYSSGALTVNPATLTVAANDQAKSYGSTFTFDGSQFTPTGLANSETIGTVTMSSAGASSGAHVVGSPYAITASAATGGTFTASDYTIGYSSGALTVNPATLTVTANNGSKTYGGTTTFAGTEFTPTGLVNSETIGSVTLTSSGASSGAHVGGNPYAIVASAAIGGTFTASDYTIGYTAGALTINPAALTVTANNGSKSYGGTTTFNGTDFTSSGLVNSETIGSVTLNSAGAASGAHVVGGPYTIVASAATGGTFTATDYTIGYTAGALAVNPAGLTVAANNQTKTYGSTFTFNGSEFTSTGLANSETIGSVTMGSAGAASGAHVAGGPYAIVASVAAGGTFTASDYTIGYTTGLLTVNPASLTVTANNGTKTYGGTTTFNGTDFTSNGLVNSETIGSVTLSSSGASSGAHVAGSPYAIVASAATGGTFTASDYTVGYMAGSLTVTPATLSIATNDQTKTYGTTFAFNGTEFTASGLVNGETIGNAVLTSAGASSGAHVAGSPYAIVASAFSGGTFTPSDYSIGPANGVLTVTPAALTLTANDLVKTYGNTLTFAGTEFTTAGLANGETVGRVTLASAGAAGSAHVASGPYATVASAAGGGTFTPSDYAIGYANGVLTITPAPLTVTIDDQSRTYGAANPVLTRQVTGGSLMNGDALSGSASTAATLASNVGAYAIGRGTLDAGSDYLLGVANGTLTIGRADLAIASGNVIKTYDGTTSAVGTASVTAGTRLFGSDSLGGGSFAFTTADAGAGNKVVSTSAVTVSDGNGGGNYAVRYVDNTTSTIDRAPLAFAGTVADRSYDGTNVATLSGYTLGGLVGGQTVVASSAPATFADPNAALGKPVTIGGVVLGDGANGGLASNYIVTSFAALTGNIDRRSLTVTATVANKIYDGTTSATMQGVVLTGLVGSETLLGPSAGTATFADKNAGDGKTVAIVGLGFSNGANGGLATNYRVPDTASARADIAQAPLVVTASGVDRVYDGTTAATVTLSASALGSDVVRAGYGTASFGDKDAGAGKMVSVGGIALSGADAANYRTNAQATTDATITRATLTVGATGRPKVYDGTDVATVTLTDDRIAGDRLTITDTSATFDDSRVGNGKPITVTGLRIASGADQGNYLLGSTVASTSADITASGEIPIAVTTSPMAPVRPVLPRTVASVIAPPAAVLDLTLPPCFGEGPASAADIASRAERTRPREIPRPAFPAAPSPGRECS